MPHSEAGERIEPPVSEPSAPSAKPAATAAAEPLEEPAGSCAVFHGFFAGGQGRSCDGPPMANSQVASLPRMTAPASRRRAVTKASSADTLSFSTAEWAVVGWPL